MNSVSNVGRTIIFEAGGAINDAVALTVDFIADNRQRAQSATEQYLDGTLTTADPSLVVLGLSSASEGITLTDLPSYIPDDARVLGLGGGGRNMRDVERFATPLFNSQVNPDLVVFAINPFHLIDPPSPTTGFLENLGKQRTRYELFGLWLVTRRGDAKYAIDAQIDRLRSAIFSIFGVRLEDEREPWREMQRMGLAQVSEESEWQSNVKAYGERGYYITEGYTSSSTQIDILLDLIAEFRRQESRVAIVLMPEHSRLRERIPGVAIRLLEDALSTHFGSQAPPIVNLQASVLDSGFSDISHMNEQGRRLFSPQFGAVIDDLMTETFN